MRGRSCRISGCIWVGIFENEGGFAAASKTPTLDVGDYQESAETPLTRDKEKRRSTRTWILNADYDRRLRYPLTKGRRPHMSSHGPRFGGRTTHTQRLAMRGWVEGLDRYGILDSPPLTADEVGDLFDNMSVEFDHNS